MTALQVLLPDLPPGADKAIVAEFNLAASHPGLRDSRPFVDAVLERLDGGPTVAAAGFADFVRMNGAVRYWQASDADEIRRVTPGGFVTRGWFDAFGAIVRRGTRVRCEAPQPEGCRRQRGAGVDVGERRPVGARADAPRSRTRRTRRRALWRSSGSSLIDLTLMDGRSAPAIYLPMPRETPGSIVLVVRASQPASAMPAIKAAVSAADPAIPWVSLETLEARALESVRGLRDGVWLGAGLGTVASAPGRGRSSCGPHLHDSPAHA